MDFINKLLFLILLISSTTLHAEQFSGANVASPLIAVGKSGLDIQQPLILVSDDNGKKWSSALPSSEEREESSLLLSACNNNQCVAIGNHQFRDPFPLIYTSSDAKHSWHVNTNIEGLPEDLRSVDLSGLSCVGNICIAVGRCGTGSHEAFAPMILRSEDSGTTWKFIKDISSLYPSDFLFQELSISCSATNCAVVAPTVKNGTFTPFILTTHDSGHSWTYIDKIANIPAEKNLFLANVNCDGANCVAVGMENNLQQQERKPLFIFSNDAGSTWSYSKEIAGFSPENNHLFITTINCSGTLCVAGGANFGFDSTSNNPLLFTSRDSGKSWAKASLPISFRQYGAINSIQCKGSSCIVLGGYPSFILTSQDKGLSWQKTEMIPSHPLILVSSSLNSLGCRGNDCLIVGTQYVVGTYHPFFLLSHDHGITWQVNKNISGLPITELNFVATNVNDSRGDTPYRLFGVIKSNLDWLKKLNK